jgi:uncharacterized repeat protein (TIGR03803 family)
MKIRKSGCRFFAPVLVLAISAFAGDKLVTIHAFSGGAGSGNPAFQLVQDSTGNLYGTTFWGGNMHGCSGQGCGVAYRLSPVSATQWKYTELYQFPGYNEGAEPTSLILDAAGNLYGEMSSAGPHGNGLVFELSPMASGPWTFTTLYAFTGGPDGGNPNGGLIFDAAGNLYGTTHYGGGGSGNGTVFELSPQAGGGWTETVLWPFNSGTGAGENPNAGLIPDAAGNLYGTTAGGNGGVFKLSHGSSGWTATSLYSFTGGSDGAVPEAALTMDASGNLYSTTIAGGTSSMGTVFELSPTTGGTYNFSVIHAFTTAQGSSYYAVTLDSVGNLLGVADNGSTSPAGEIFKLVHTGSTWSYGTIHNFSVTDGAQPNTLTMDSSGNFYGVTNYGDVAGCINNSGCGTVFKLVPEPAAKN